MKLTTALCFLTISSYVVAAPISMTLDQVPARADLFNSSMRQEPRIKSPIKAPTRPSSKVSEKKVSKAHNVASSSSPKRPKGPSRKSKPTYLASLAHRLTNKSPFSESSIVREETRASTGDWEREATIVEWETKASRDSREAYIWIPCFSTSKTLRYHRIRVNTDMLVVSLVLSLTAIILVIEMWKPVAARLGRFRSGYGPIHLEINEMAGKENSAEKPSISYGPTLEENNQSKLEGSAVELAITKQ